MEHKYKKWSVDEDIFLIENYHKLFMKDICKKLKRDHKVVHRHALSLGLSKKELLYRKNYIGKVFNRLTVIEYDGYKISPSTGKKDIVWKCACVCGEIVSSRLSNLLNGTTQSCGCIYKDNRYILPEGKSCFNRLLGSYVRSARNRNYEFKLTSKEFEEICLKNCYYCGVIPKQIFRSKNLNGVFIYNGIDRKDNSIGYTLENCVPCCKFCNSAKKDQSIEEFLDWIENLVKFRGDKRDKNK